MNGEEDPQEPQQPIEEDSINIMIGEEDVNFDEDPPAKNGNAAPTTATPAAGSPPRPETAPVVQPFTSKDTISMHASSKTGAHSENSSMLVNPPDLDDEQDEDNKSEEKDNNNRVWPFKR